MRWKMTLPLLLTICLLLLLLLTAQPYAWLAALLPVPVGICSAVFTLLGRKSWSLHLTAPVIGEKRQELTITALADSTSKLPIGRLYCCLQVQNDLTGERQDIRLLLPAGEERTIHLTAACCGRLTVTAQKVQLLGSLGVLAIRVPVEAQCRTTIQPDTFEPALRLQIPELSNSDSDTYAPDRRGNDPSETYALRDYLPGDSLRSIHWKLTSKTDRLVVREASQPVERSLLVFWDKTSAAPADSDTQAEVFASLCQTLCHLGYAFTVGWNEAEGAIYCPVEGEDELLRVIPMALRSGAAPQTAPEPFGKTILLTTDPQTTADDRTAILFCGSAHPDAVCYTPETYLTILQTIEL